MVFWDNGNRNVIEKDVWLYHYYQVSLSLNTRELIQECYCMKTIVVRSVQIISNTHNWLLLTKTMDRLFPTLRWNILEIVKWCKKVHTIKMDDEKDSTGWKKTGQISGHMEGVKVQEKREKKWRERSPKIQEGLNGDFLSFVYVPHRSHGLMIMIMVMVVMMMMMMNFGILVVPGLWRGFPCYKPYFPLWTRFKYEFIECNLSWAGTDNQGCFVESSCRVISSSFVFFTLNSKEFFSIHSAALCVKRVVSDTMSRVQKDLSTLCQNWYIGITYVSLDISMVLDRFSSRLQRLCTKINEVSSSTWTVFQDRERD